VAAAAIGRGLDIKLLLAMRTAPECEGLAVTANSPIRPEDPKSLTQSVIAVPFGSTSHFRLLQSLRKWGASPTALRLANLQATQISQAWRRREIDAAAISEPMLGVLAKDGRLVPLVAPSTKVGLILLAARADFVATHVVFLSRLIDLMTQPANAKALGISEQSVDSKEVEAIARISGLQPSEIPAAVELHQPPQIDEQLSDRLLGGDSSLVASQLKEALEVWRWAGRPSHADADLSDAIALEPLQRARSYRR
jgi:taurine transport system substrate-binding protein